MDSGNKESLEQTVAETLNTEEKQPVPVYAEPAEDHPAEPVDEQEMHKLALAYAKYLAEHDLIPGDLTFTDPEELMSEEPAEEAAEEAVPQPEEAPAEVLVVPEQKEEVPKGKKASLFKGSDYFSTPEICDEEAAAAGRSMGKSEKSFRKVSLPIDLFDRLQEKIGSAMINLGEDFVKGGYRILSTYRQSRRAIGIAILIIGVIVAVLLAVFDHFTVYEYSYNGKILGYVQNQDDVIDVLDIAGKELTENNTGSAEIKFVPNQNIMFNVIDGRGKSIDDADIVVNKLMYMTDIETEAFGIYDGDALVAVVKSQSEAESLLNATMNVLSEPDDGMNLVSAEFSNELDIRPINVMLKSIQSYSDALTTMTEGGSIEIYHIVENEENLLNLSRTFSIEPTSIFNEDNSSVISAVEQGDKICIHKEISPVQVKMVEKGRMKEIDEYETVKKESDQYYKGDTHLEQKGVNGVQIFQGTVTKLGGEVIKRDTENIEVITERKDKIILVGTAERPKTAPTGTFIVPLRNYEGISSNFGYRWGRLHSGIDMGASHGTPIYASDGGTVKMAGWYYGYGLCVDIDHGNGRVTRYGHCSQLLVNAGDQVYQGQNIALVGNTGHSFGNHLHFEVQINGTPVNPRPYLGI